MLLSLQVSQHRERQTLAPRRRRRRRRVCGAGGWLLASAMADKGGKRREKSRSVVQAVRVRGTSSSSWLWR